VFFGLWSLIHPKFSTTLIVFDSPGLSITGDNALITFVVFSINESVISFGEKFLSSN
jgi:hypothetical protein